MLLAALREAVAAGGRELDRTGLVPAATGNLSVRDPGGGLVAISPSELPYDRVGPADVAVVDADGRPLEGRHRPSSELSLHLAVYRRRVDVGAVVHTHSPWATALAVLGREIPAVHYAIAPMGDAVRVVPYATFGSGELARLVAGALGSDNAVLLANHGVVTVGPDLASALRYAVAVEFLAEVYWKASQAGEPVVLSPDELERVRAQAAALGSEEIGGGEGG